MYYNGNKMRSDSELSDYQKKLDSIDNVILCVAEAEHFIKTLGHLLVTETNIDDRWTRKNLRKRKSPWTLHKYSR